LALYHPRLGYYSSGQERVGAAGDYYTSPHAHPAFGALLALQLEEMWQWLGCPSPFTVVEAGAGNGRLATDIHDYCRHLGEEFRQALRYVVIDIHIGAVPQSPSLAAIVSDTIPLRGVRGCILSNELLDAFPVHRLVVRDGAALEIYVGLDGEELVDLPGEPSPPAQELLRQMKVLPPEGQEFEVSPQQWHWMGEAGRALERGFVLTIDYGYLSPPAGGTVVPYRGHSQGGNLYLGVGEQDLSAHVDFGALVVAGQWAGLEPLGLVSQRDFLNNLGLSLFLEAAARLGLPQAQHQANQMGMRALTRREGLGSLRVLVQGKGVSGARLSGLEPNSGIRQRLEAWQELPLPLLTPQHTPLLEGHYPHLAWDIA